MKTIWACLCAGDILLRREGADGAFSLPYGDEPPVALQPWSNITTLKDFKIEELKIDNERIKGFVQQESFNQKSLNSEITLRIVRLDKPVVGVESLEMMGLRKSHAVLSPEEYQLASKAAELLYWDQNTKYCGVCGAPTKWMTDISKKCPECGKEWWPSPSTAIIVRVCRMRQSDNLQSGNCGKGNAIQSSNCKSSNCQNSEVLLVRARNFRSNHYGLVAGFLETGESLEECVERELREEVGIRIKNLKYFGSQPWPYPFGLMVGFTADYADGEIRLQKEELTEGGWFTRDNMPPIPDKASIARRLIDDWLLAEP